MYLSLFIGSAILFYVLEQYLRHRKAKAFAEGFPSALKGLGLEDGYEKTVDYNSEKNSFGSILNR